MVKYSIILHANVNVFSWEMADGLRSYILIMLIVYCSMQSAYLDHCLYVWWRDSVSMVISIMGCGKKIKNKATYALLFL